MFGGSTRMIRAEGTRTISASRSTIPCHFRMISAGTGVAWSMSIRLGGRDTHGSCAKVIEHDVAIMK